jgi:hypothetical protein
MQRETFVSSRKKEKSKAFSNTLKAFFITEAYLAKAENSAKPFSIWWQGTYDTLPFQCLGLT